MSDPSDDKPKRRSLVDQKSTGGATALAGFDFQRRYALILLIQSLPNPDFSEILVEGAEDVEARFDTRTGVRRRAIQVKNYRVTTAKAKEIIEDFRKLDDDSPGTWTSFVIACAELDDKLKTIDNRLEDYRNLQESYRDKEVLAETRATLEETIGGAGLPVAFVIERVSFEPDPMYHSNELVRARAVDLLQEAYPGLDWGTARDTYFRLHELVSASPRKLITRQEAEDRLRKFVAGGQPLLRKVFDPLIEKSTALFGGREAALAEIDEFIHDPAGGYLVVTAPAGFGKTALMAYLVSRTSHTCAYHFFTPLYGDDSLSEAFFLRDVVQQIAGWHGYQQELPRQLNELRAIYQEFIKKPLEEARVLVLDGLDEVNGWKLTPYLKRRLPDNLHFILTVRDVGQDWRADYELPDDQVTHLPLGGLTTDEIRAVLIAAGGQAATLVANPQIVDQIAEVAAYEENKELGADPFYVRLLAEDAAKGQLSADKRLEDYLDEWWKQIKAVAGDQPTRDLFGTLTVALGPMGRSDLEAINPSLVDDWAEDRFDDVLSSVRRFVIVDEKGGYALFHPRLHQYVRTRIKTGPYLNKLLDYCARWRDHKSRYALTHYARHLVEAGDFNGFYGLISKEWMDAKLAAFHSPQPFSEDVALAVEVAGQEQPPNWAQLIRGCLIYATLGSQATDVPAEVIGALAQIGQIDTALGYAALIQDINRRSSAYKSVVQRLLERGNHFLEKGAEADARQELREALAVIQIIEVENDKAEALGKVARAMAKVEMRELLEHASAVASAIHYEGPRVRALSEVAQALHQVGMKDEAKAAATKALRAAEAMLDEGRKAEALGKTAQALGQLGMVEDLEDALAAAEAIQDEGYKARALGDVTAALNQAGKREDAEKVAEMALMMAKDIQDGWSKASALSGLAQALAQAGMKDAVRQALKTAKAMRDEGPKAEALGKVAQAVAQVGMKKELQQTLTAAKAIQDEWYRASTLSEVAQAQAQVGMMGQALKTAKAIRNEWYKAQALGEVAHILAKTKMTEELEQILAAAEDIQDEAYKADALGKVAEALAQAELTDMALDAATKTQAAAADIQDEKDKAEALGKVVQTLAQVGMIEQALMTAKAIQYEWPKAEALGKLAQALALAEMGNEAASAATMALAASVVQHRGPKAWGLSGMAQALAQAGMLDEAEKAATAAMTTAKSTHDESYRAHALGGVAQASSLGKMTKKLDQALEAAVGIQDNGFKAQALGEVAQALNQAGMRSEATSASIKALAAAKVSQYDWMKARVLGEVAQVLAQMRMIKELKQALAAAFTIQDEAYKAEALGRVAQAMAGTEIGDEATRSAAAALAAANAIQNVWSKVGTLTEVTQALAQAGMSDKAQRAASSALEIAETIEDNKSRARMLSEVTQALAQAGMSEKAVSAANSALEAAKDTQDVEVLSKVVQALAQVGMMDKAISTASTALAEAKGIEDDEFKASALGGLALSLAQAGMMEQALVAADAIPYGEEVKEEALGTIAQALNQLKSRDEALTLLLDVFGTARFGGRRSVYRVLAHSSQFLADIDRGQTLWRVYEKVMEAEGWWR